jgi:hypothetical protein
MSRIIERRGDYVYVEEENDWTGETTQEWRYDPEPRCACGNRTINQCREVRVTTFSETYECGYTYRYTNHNGYEDNLIFVNGKRVK